jgi:DNA-3-methyladenine glycosylase II
MTSLTPWTDVVQAATTNLGAVDPIMAETIAQIGPCTLQPNPNTFEALVVSL